jgi:hypothetical protein
MGSYPNMLSSNLSLSKEMARLNVFVRQSGAPRVVVLSFVIGPINA